MNETIQTKGQVSLSIEYDDGTIVNTSFKNTILAVGREALTSCLANSIGDSFNFYISRMIFGDGGTTGGVPKLVNANRNGLFGTTRISKPVFANIDPNVTSQVVFTSVIPASEGNGYTYNEMALRLNNGDLYSMVTFPDLNKTASMQWTWTWRLNFI